MTPQELQMIKKAFMEGYDKGFEAGITFNSPQDIKQSLDNSNNSIVIDSSKGVCKETKPIRDTPEDTIQSKHKAEIDKGYSISGDDRCWCGHLREEHSQFGCDICSCHKFALTKISAVKDKERVKETK